MRRPFPCLDEDATITRRLGGVRDASMREPHGKLRAMVAALPAPNFEEDQHGVLRAMSWQDFEALLAIRGERSGVRMYYLDGEIEIVSPTKIHEERKTTLARLLEIWA